MADSCPTPEKYKKSSDEVVEKLFSVGIKGLSEQIKYIYDKKGVDSIIKLAPYLKESYLKLHNRPLRPDQKAELTTPNRVQNFDIASYIKSVQDAAQKQERIKAQQERRMAKEPDESLRPVSRLEFSGAALPEGPNIRPSLRYAHTGLLRSEVGNVTFDDYPIIDGNQKYGINAMVEAHKQGKPGFILADGPGVGKTIQLLITANEIAKTSGKPVIIVVPNTQIRDSRFKADAQLVNRTATDSIRITPSVQNGSVAIVTYSDIRSGRYDSYDFGAVLFDESHNIASETSKQSEKSRGLTTDFMVFASGTPFDNANGIAFFLSRVLGMNQGDMEMDLGYWIDNGKIIYDKKFNNDNYKFFLHLIERLNVHVPKMIGQGVMLHRFYPFFGKVTSADVEPLLTSNDPVNVWQYWTKSISNFIRANEKEKDTAKFKGILERMGSSRLSNTSYATEYAKGAIVSKMMMQDIADGYKVVIATEYIGNRSGGYTMEIEGLGGAMAKVQAVKKKKAEGLQESPKDISVVKSAYGQVIEALQNNGVKFTELNGDITEVQRQKNIADFQTGTAQVMVMTIKSGGTGVDLDDQVGGSPRKMYVLSTPYSAKESEQVYYRVSRKNTKSPAEVINVEISNSNSDIRRKLISGARKDILGAALNQADVGVLTGGFTQFASNPETAETEMLLSIFYAENSEALKAKKINNYTDLMNDYKKYMSIFENANDDIADYFAKLKKC
jgi:hypothetical protein